MAKQPETNQDKIDVLYQWLSYELQQTKDTLLTELKMSSAQIGSLYGELKSENDASSKAVAQEIRYSYKQNQTIYDGLSAMLTKEVGERLNSVDEKLGAISEIQTLLNEIDELKHCYMELLGDTRALNDTVANDVTPKLDDIAQKQAVLDQLEETLNAINAKIEEFCLSERDLQKLTETISEKTEKSVSEHSEQVLNAVGAIENVDYTRIAEDVGDKLIEILNEIKSEEVPVAEVVETEAEKIDYDRIIYGAAEKVVESLPATEKIDYSRIESAMPTLDIDALAETVASKIAVPAAPEAPEVDYERLADLVSTRIAVPEAPEAPEVDYERLADLVSTRIAVPEAPAAPEVDYNHLADLVGERVIIPEVEVNYERLADLVSARITVPAAPAAPEVDYERLADLVSARISVPAAPAAPEVDYERLAQLVMDKMANDTEQTCEVMLDDAGIEEIATKVAGKISTPESIDYDKVCQAAQAAQILPDPVDYDRIAEIVEDKLANEDSTYDLVMDEEGLNAIAKGVSQEIQQLCSIMSIPEETTEEVVEEAPVEETVEEPVEETVIEEAVVEEVAEEAPVEETVEEPVEEVVEEIAVEEVVEEAPVEETVEELTEETPVEEVVEEAPVEEVVEAPVEETPVEVESAADALVEELATTAVPMFDETGNELVDAESGLVIRLKRSFTAKMKQSDEKVKGYYSDIKNELTSYKKINSNVSWHGDRFNYGRETVAKININGKTLCFYVALDPNDPQLKTTIYHQKDVGAQKAYENTPFMVKVKSDAAAKKALRLVGVLAEKLGTDKEENFEAVDYVEEFSYQSTKQLYEDGYIKATKEKKVNFDF